MKTWFKNLPLFLLTAAFFIGHYSSGQSVINCSVSVSPELKTGTTDTVIVEIPSAYNFKNVHVWYKVCSDRNNPESSIIYQQDSLIGDLAIKEIKIVRFNAKPWHVASVLSKRKNLYIFYGAAPSAADLPASNLQPYVRKACGKNTGCVFKKVIKETKVAIEQSKH